MLLRTVLAAYEKCCIVISNLKWTTEGPYPLLVIRTVIMWCVIPHFECAAVTTNLDTSSSLTKLTGSAKLSTQPI